MATDPEIDKIQAESVAEVMIREDDLEVLRRAGRVLHGLRKETGPGLVQATIDTWDREQALLKQALERTGRRHAQQ